MRTMAQRRGASTRPGPGRVTRQVVAAVPAGIAWVLVLQLGRAYLTDDFAVRVVAEQGRGDAEWYYRIAGAWATAQGSLLLFAAIVGLVGVIGTRGQPRAAMVAGVTTAAVLAVDLLWASPFARLAVPAVSGLGLTPILEHWAMTIHPPLLYLAVACGVPPFARFVAGSPDDHPTERRRGGAGTAHESARRWLLTGLALTTVAMALGAYWSYAEQGWGGYWAWDPVENSSLVGWLALVAAVHGMARWRPAATTQHFELSWLVTVPWCVALLGAAASRSGAVPSVHAFAEAGRVGAALAALGALTVAVASLVAVRGSASSSVGRLPPGWRRFPLVLALGALAVVALGIATPFALRALGDQVRVTGGFYARVLLPLALAALALLAVVAVAARNGTRLPGAAWVAHAGFAVVVVGALVSTFDHHASVNVARGDTVELLGLDVTNRGVSVVPGPRPGTRSVRVELVVDGTSVQPSLTAYPERGGVLAETSTLHRLNRDVQVAVVRADDEGHVLLELRTRPGVVAVWVGSALLAAGALLSVRPAGRGAARHRDRPAEPASAPAAR